MPDLVDEDIIPWLLDKLVRHGWWEARHTSFDNVPKGAPPHMHGKIKNVAEDLIKQGFIRKKPTGYGVEISLNIAKKDEIFDIIEHWKQKKAQK